MKKSLLLFVLFCSAVALYAQEVNESTGVGLGVNTHTTGFYIGLVIVLIFGGVFAFLSLRSYGNRRFIEKKTIEALKVKKWQIPKPGDYEYECPRYSTVGAYVSRLNNKIMVRDTYLTDKNQLIFATSLAHNLTEKDQKVLLAYLPQLVDVNINKSHEVIVTKSPAVDLSSFEKTFLEFLFAHLYHSYKWMQEEQKITIHRVEEFGVADCFQIFMRSEIFDYLYLEKHLKNIEGVIDVFARDVILDSNNNLPPASESNISFIISRCYDSDWEEMFLKIKQVFTDHIKSGVKFML